jgi:hypothetical protein
MTSTPKVGWECEVPIKTSNFVALEHEFFKLNQFVRKTSAGLDSEEDPRKFFLGSLTTVQHSMIVVNPGCIFGLSCVFVGSIRGG